MKYIKPEIKVIKLQYDYLLQSSHQCDCYEYREHRGCVGCKGNCGYDHWDEETQTHIPGC